MSSDEEGGSFSRGTKPSRRAKRKAKKGTAGDARGPISTTRLTIKISQKMPAESSHPPLASVLRDKFPHLNVDSEGYEDSTENIEFVDAVVVTSKIKSEKFMRKR